MSLKNKKLLLLGGSRNMDDILSVAHEMGVWVGVTDWYDIKRSPVKLMADEYFNVSIEDCGALMDIITKHSYDGVLTGYTDSYLLPYAKICQKANIPSYGTVEQFEILTDKRRYKKLFYDYGVPTLPEYKIDQIDEHFNNYPLILKPVKGSGGVGLRQLDNYSEILELTDSNKNSQNLNNYLVEPYLRERKEITAFFLFVDGEVYISGTANRFLSMPQGDKIGLPILYEMPASYDEAFRKTTAPPMIEMFKGLGLQNGILFAQCIVIDDVPLVYDVGYRPTGTLEYRLQEELYGFNPLKMLVYLSLTGENPAKDYNFINKTIKQNQRLGFNVTILGKEGTISTIKGIEEILAIPGVLDCVFKIVVGDSIAKPTIGTLGQIIARIFFTADSIAEAIEVLKQIYEHIQICDQDGEDMILERYSPHLLQNEHK